MQSAMEQEVAQLIVKTLDLDVTPAEIKPEDPLFYEGLGLDSIDALELAIEITGKYGFELRADDENNKRIFSSLRSLTAHIEGQRAH